MEPDNIHDPYDEGDDGSRAFQELALLVLVTVLSVNLYMLQDTIKYLWEWREPQSLVFHDPDYDGLGCSDGVTVAERRGTGVVWVGDTGVYAVSVANSSNISSGYIVHNRMLTCTTSPHSR